jgi:hypothetical protein
MQGSVIACNAGIGQNGTLFIIKVIEAERAIGIRGDLFGKAWIVMQSLNNES